MLRLKLAEGDYIARNNDKWYWSISIAPGPTPEGIEGGRIRILDAYCVDGHQFVHWKKGKWVLEPDTPSQMELVARLRQEYDG